MLRNPTLLAAVAIVICLPILFAAVGGSQTAGLIIGIVLVLVGVFAGLRGRDR